MIVEQAEHCLTIHAPAKLNLHLEILSKRADGYHELETVLVSVSLYDTLVLRPADSGEVFRCSNAALPVGEANLVLRAVALARLVSGRDDGLAIELTKRIPVGAGLGGGSSDAAATLAGLAQCWKLDWDNRRLGELGAMLGSDVPFFFHTPAAVARGRGEVVEPIRLGRAIFFVVVCPHEGLSTEEVYRHVTVPSRSVPSADMMSALAAGNIEKVGRRLHNRLEEPAARVCPAVARWLERAAQWDCLGFRMTGSGSALFAVCADESQANRLAREIGPVRSAKVFVLHSSS